MKHVAIFCISVIISQMYQSLITRLLAAALLAFSLFYSGGSWAQRSYGHAPRQPSISFPLTAPGAPAGNYVIAGSFRNKTRADQLAYDLERQTITASNLRVMSARAAYATTWRVAFGPVSAAQERLLLRELFSRGIEDRWVLRNVTDGYYISHTPPTAPPSLSARSTRNLSTHREVQSQPDRFEVEEEVAPCKENADSPECDLDYNLAKLRRKSKQ